MNIRRRLVLQATMGLAVPTLPLAVHAQQGFPNKPIKIVVPYAAGGITDILSRLLAQQMETSLGQRVLVDNRPGAGGITGTDLVAKSPADGYTMILGALAPFVISRITNKLPYDPVADFIPITQIATAPLALVVHPSVPARTPKELVDLLKAKPDSLSYASAGAGTPSHLAAELFKRETGVAITHVPYKGTGASLNDLIAGQVQLMWDSPTAQLPFVKAGKLRQLAVTGTTRSPLMPDVPTFIESGVSGVEVNGWYGLLAPAQTPAAVVDRLRAAITEAVRKPEITARMIEMGAIPRVGTTKDFADYMAAEYTRWVPVVKALNLPAT